MSLRRTISVISSASITLSLGRVYSPVAGSIRADERVQVWCSRFRRSPSRHIVMRKRTGLHNSGERITPAMLSMYVIGSQSGPPSCSKMQMDIQRIRNGDDHSRALRVVFGSASVYQNNDVKLRVLRGQMNGEVGNDTTMVRRNTSASTAGFRLDYPPK